MHHRPAASPRTARATLAVLVAIAALSLLVASPALAGGPRTTPASVTYDLLVERPLGLVELATGVAILPVAWPVAATADHGELVVDRCVRTPGRSTFQRSLGHLEEDRRSSCSPVAFGFEMTQLSMGAALQPLAWIFGGSPFSPHRERRDGVEI